MIDIETEPIIAASPMPWGLGSHLTGLVPGTRAVKVTGDEIAIAIEAVQGARDVVVVTREAHRHPEVREFLSWLRESSVDYIRVETGVPGPETEGPRIDTFSGSYVSLRAAAEYLA